MHLHTFQHVAFEWVGQIESWAKARGHTLSATRFFEKFEFPDPNKIDLLLVMGGPMGVHDEKEYPWLAEEKRFLYNYIYSDKRTLGICLGAQLIADILGARVYRAPEKEIGWFPVRLTPEGIRSGFFPSDTSALTAFHWHQDTFDLPRGTIQLAKSAACEQQAFARGRRQVGVQFHIEMTGVEAADLCRHCPEDVAAPGPTVQDAATIANEAGRYAAECRRQLEFLLDRITG